MSAPLRQEWFSASELAGLPGMSAHRETIIRVAARRGWQSREIPVAGARGVGLEFHISSLPPETQAELARRAALLEHPAALTAAYRAGSELAEALRPTTARATTSPVSSDQQPVSTPAAERRTAIARARLEVLRQRDAFCASSGLAKAEAAAVFAAGYSEGRIAMSSEVRALIPRVSARTLARWEASERRAGVTGLETRHGWRRGQTVIDEHPEVAEAIVALMAQRPHTRARHVHEYVEARWPELALSEATVRRWVQAWQAAHPYAWARLLNPDAAKSRYLPAFGSASEAFTRPNQQWELDSSPADILLADGRHTLIAAIDVFTRRVRFVLAKSSRAESVAAVVRKAILAWGVPESVRTDNGRDYTSTFLGEFLRSLEVEQVLCPPFRGDKKPHVERIFGTLQRDVIELLPGYCGHSVSERQAIEARRSKAEQIALGAERVIEASLTADELRRRIEQWVAVYEATPHAGLNGLSPSEVARRHEGATRRIESERQLDMLLAEPPRGARGCRTVAKRGLRLEGADFVAPELADCIGRRVRVRLDPEDLGRVWVFGEDWTFICVAECPERTGISRAEVAAKARARVKDIDRQVGRLKREAKRAVNVDDIAATIMEARERGLAPVVPLLPPPSVTHTTPALEAAAQAIAEIDRQPAPYTAEEAAEQAAFAARLEAARAEVDARIRSAREERESLISEWCSLAERLGELDEDDRAWVEAIAATEPDVRLWVPEHRPDLAHLIPSPTARHLRLA